MENTPEKNDLNPKEKNLTEQPTIFSDIYMDTSAYEKTIRQARNWLFVIGVLQIVMGVVQYIRSDDYLSNGREIWLSVNVIIGFAYIGLAVLSFRQPMPAFIVGLILYVVVNAWTIYAVGSASFSYYWLLKILVIIALVRAIKDAKEYTSLKNGLEDE